MIALFFEVTPREGLEDRYLEIAASLKPQLEANGGVAYLDRFRSLSRPATLLSHQIWVDEASLARWRANSRHYKAQTAGRASVFADYRLRVAPVLAWRRDDGGGIAEALAGLTYNHPERRSERWMVVVRSRQRPIDGTANGEAWRSVYSDINHAVVADVTSREAGLVLIETASRDPCVSAAQLCLVSRDYGMFDRREAPQYFPLI